MPEYEEICVTVALRIRVVITDSSPTRHEARELVIAGLRGYRFDDAAGLPVEIMDAAPRIGELE